MSYEYKLVMAEQVNAYLEKGWEPAPNVEPVITNRSAPSPFVKVFLRKRGYAEGRDELDEAYLLVEERERRIAELEQLIARQNPDWKGAP